LHSHLRKITPLARQGQQVPILKQAKSEQPQRHPLRISVFWEEKSEKQPLNPSEFPISRLALLKGGNDCGRQNHGKECHTDQKIFHGMGSSATFGLGTVAAPAGPQKDHAP